MALLIHLHGYWSQGNKTEIDQFLFSRFADEYGFIYVAPEGTIDGSGLHFWNATPACCGPTTTIDDSAYLQAVIQETRSGLNVDANRVYVSGFSNGGFMSYRLACEASESIAALISIGGATYKDPGACGASSPVHILQVHGTADVNVLPSGGQGFRSSSSAYPGAMETVQQWAAINGCSGIPRISADQDLLAKLGGYETGVSPFVDGCNVGGSAELWLSAGGTHFSFLSEVGFARHAIEWLFDHPKRPAPVASFVLSTVEGESPVQVAVDGSNSSFPDGSIAAYHWLFSDGSTAEGVTAVHTHESPGRHIVSLTVVSDDQKVSARSRKIVTALSPSGDTAPWIAGAVGEPAFPGSARLDGIGEERALQVYAGGRDIGLRADECLMVYQEIAGDFRMTAEVTDFTASRTLAKVGLMARADLDPGSPFAGALLETSGSGPDFEGFVRARYRSDMGGSAKTNGRESCDALHCWLRLERRANSFTAATSLDGSEFKLLHEQVIDALPDSLLVGIAATGHDTDPGDGTFRPAHASIANLSIEGIGQRFHRGDPNSSGATDISDGVAIFDHLFLGGPEPSCKESADANNDGAVDISDGIYLLSWLFIGGPAPVAPGAGGMPCGRDIDEPGSPGDLGCESYGGCE